MENIYFRNIYIPEKEYVEEYEEGDTTILCLDKKKWMEVLSLVLNAGC